MVQFVNGLILFLFFINHAFSQSLPQSNSPFKIFYKVNVVPMDSKRVQRNQSVVVFKDKIIFIGKLPIKTLHTFLNTFKDTLLINGQGNYLMPGLVDMHVHLGRVYSNENEFMLYLANGVTTVREMSTRNHDYFLIKKSIETNERLGPNLILVSPFSGGVTGEGPEQAWSIEKTLTKLEEYKQLGYEGFKVGDLFTPEVYEALAKRAHELQIPLVGHVPYQVPLTQIFTLGQRTLEHFAPGYSIALEAEDSPLKNNQSPISIWYLKQAFMDPKKLKSVMKLASRSQTWHTATAFISWTFAFPERFHELLMRDEMRFAPKAWREDTKSFMVEWEKMVAQEGGTHLIKKGYKNFLKMIQSAHRHRVPLLIGTDSAHVIPGFSYHDEMRLHQIAGLKPYDILRAATRNAYESLILPTEDFGRVAVGSRADLLLLSANPLKSLKNVKKMKGVMVRGHWLSAEEIKERLKKVEAAEPNE